MRRLGIGLGLGLGLRLPNLVYPGGGFVDIVNNGVLAPFVTFTRASTATYFDSAGVMQTAAVNEPRIDYDPATGELRGLLIEEQRTNLLLNSAVLSTQSVTVTAVAHTLSFTGTGTVTLSGASTAGPLVGTGANDRVTLTFTPTAGSLTLTVSGSVTLAQLEAGAFATSYIPTTDTAQTRAADDPRVSTLSSIGFNAAASSIFVEAECAYVDAGNQVGALFELFGSATNYVRFYLDATGARTGQPVTWVRNSTLVQLMGNTSQYSPPLAQIRVATAYDAATSAMCTNGASVVEAVSPPVLPAPTILHIGRQNGTPATTGSYWIRRMRYYPRRLPNAQLQALTA